MIKFSACYLKSVVCGVSNIFVLVGELELASWLREIMVALQNIEVRQEALRRAVAFLNG